MTDKKITILKKIKEKYIYTLAIVFIAVSVPHFFIFRLIGAIEASNLVILVVFLHVCCLIFRRYYNMAGLVLTSHTSLCLLYYGSIFGKEVGPHTVCYAMIVISFSIHTTKHLYYLIVGSLVPITVLFLLEFNDFGLFPRFELSINQAKLIGLSVNLTMLIMTIFALAYYFKFQNKYQAILKTNSKVSLSSYKITEREQEIVDCIIDGLSNKEIAEALIIEESTVKTHISKVYRKLEVTSRTQLMSKLTQDIEV